MHLLQFSPLPSSNHHSLPNRNIYILQGFMNWGWYLESPHNPSTSVFLSQVCSSAVSTHISHSICAMGGGTLISKGCCHHTSSIATHCNKACCEVRYGARAFLFVLPLSFIRIWRNHHINLKKIKNCISPHPSTHDSQCLRAPAELPGVTTHLNHISLPCHDFKSRCMLIPSPPQPHAYLVCQQSLLLFQEFTACQQSFWG